MKEDMPSHSRVVTRYMGSGITASGSGSWTRDSGSQVMGSGSANFFFVLEGIKDRSLFRYFILYEKQEYSVLQGKRPLFRTTEKAFNLYTSILLRFRHNQLFKAFLARISCCIAVSALSDSLRNRILAYRYPAFMMRD